MQVDDGSGCDFISIDQLLWSIHRIKGQKQKVQEERICATMLKQFSVKSDVTLKQLELAVSAGYISKRITHKHPSYWPGPQLIKDAIDSGGCKLDDILNKICINHGLDPTPEFKDQVKSTIALMLGRSDLEKHGQLYKVPPISEARDSELSSSKAKPIAVCSFCLGTEKSNKNGEAEELISCHECGNSGHPSCLHYSSELVARIKLEPWLCLDCKKCMICLKKGDDDRLLFCDACDKGFHMDCMDPPVNSLPEGRWICPDCNPSPNKQKRPIMQSSYNMPTKIVDIETSPSNRKKCKKTGDDDVKSTSKEVQQLISENPSHCHIEEIIRQSEEAIQQKEDIIQLNKVAAQQYQERIHEKNETIRRNEEFIRQKEDMIRQTEEMIRQREDMIQLQKVAAQQLEERIREKNKTIQEIENTIQQKEITIQQNKEAAQQEIVALRNQLDSHPWMLQDEEVEITDERIGGGSYSEVKVAIFRGTRVAAKSLHEIIVSRHNRAIVKREMDISSKIHHPNVVQFIGAITRVNSPILLYELMATSLYKRLQDDESLTRPQITGICCDIASALCYLHQWKPDPIIHRDVSSPNVLIEPLANNRWRAKLSDFGAASLQLHVKTIIPGNPAYSAPEARIPQDHTPAMDVYSFGILATEMTHHAAPEMDISKREARALMIDWIPMKEIVLNCIETDPNQRPTSLQLLQKLHEITNNFFIQDDN